MNPQIVVQDLAGVHNADLNKTSARLMKGGSWKKQRIVVILPASDTIPSKICLSVWNLAFPPNNGIIRVLAQGMEVGDAYSNAIESVLAHSELSQWEYILTVEHDNAPPADGVIKLVERMEQHPELDCISGLYFTKGEGGVAQIWGDTSDLLLNFRPQLPDTNGGLKTCYGTGMGFALWRLKMFKDQKIERPLFRTKKNINGEGLASQDLAFWAKAFKHGYKCAVDCAVKVGHYDLEGKFGPPDTMW